MINILKVRWNHGRQFIPNLRKASIHPRHRGLPRLDGSKCGGKCRGCADICPTGALSASPFRIDLGRCVFCGECSRLCPKSAVEFSSYYKLASTTREGLIIDGPVEGEAYRARAFAEPADPEARRIRDEFRRLFGRSLKIRQVSAGGCNGCEMELNACSNVNFDMGRFGIDVVASPRHADCILVTGPITENMASALEDAWPSVPRPRLLILAGACAISGGLFDGSPAVKRSFLDGKRVDLYIPGCPVHPLTVVNGLLDFLGRR
jgi:Ni,Fe-hydrogenase III small subunit/NAD-dependent dihydropyrimidine dehydrogenase PreA subunit